MLIFHSLQNTVTMASITKYIAYFYIVFLFCVFLEQAVYSDISFRMRLLAARRLNATLFLLFYSRRCAPSTGRPPPSSSKTSSNSKFYRVHPNIT